MAALSELIGLTSAIVAVGMSATGSVSQAARSASFAQNVPAGLGDFSQANKRQAPGRGPLVF